MARHTTTVFLGEVLGQVIQYPKEEGTRENQLEGKYERGAGVKTRLPEGRKINTGATQATHVPQFLSGVGIAGAEESGKISADFNRKLKVNRGEN